MNWIEYNWDDIGSRPPCPGKYLVHREKCGKTNFKQWNGSGWASDNNVITHWCEVQNPSKSKITRVEVIDNKGRSYTNMSVNHIYSQLQDAGRTLKMFLSVFILLFTMNSCLLEGNSCDFREDNEVTEIKKMQNFDRARLRIYSGIKWPNGLKQYCNSYIVCSRNKYKIGDTVKLK